MKQIFFCTVYIFYGGIAAEYRRKFGLVIAEVGLPVSKTHLTVLTNNNNVAGSSLLCDFRTNIEACMYLIILIQMTMNLYSAITCMHVQFLI